jgi:hypothetical protein
LPTCTLVVATRVFTPSVAGSIPVVGTRAQVDASITGRPGKILSPLFDPQ